jgi:hypothetical protein
MTRVCRRDQVRWSRELVDARRLGGKLVVSKAVQRRKEEGKERKETHWLPSPVLLVSPPLPAPSLQSIPLCQRERP